MNFNKNRHLESLVTDTFKYMAHVWEHFIPTMLRVNIIYLASVFFMTYFAITMNYGMIDVMPNLMGGASFPKMDYDELKGMAEAISGWKILILTLLYILFMVGFVIFESFTPAYMILQNRLGRVPTYDEIISFIKERTGRIVIFCLWTLLMWIPLGVILVIGCVVLIVTIIGIALIPLFIFMISIVGSLLFFVYLDNDKMGFFESLDIAWKRFTSHFFRYLGSGFAIYLIGTIVMFIPQTILSNAYNSSMDSVFLGIMFALLSLLLHFIISAFCNVNIGLIYFASNTANTNYSKNNPIE